LQTALDRLETSLPDLIRHTDDASLMDAIAGEAEMIEFDIDEDDRPYFSTRMRCMLRDAGIPTRRAFSIRTHRAS
jgi:hypothetical protein